MRISDWSSDVCSSDLNPHVRMRWWIAERPMDVLARNADGDELLFLHGGTAELYCDYGHLTISAGDYVMLPRGTMWRVECEAPIALLLIEATNPHYNLPDKAMVGEDAISAPAIPYHP